MNKELDFPYTFYEVDSKKSENLMKVYVDEVTGFVRVGPKGYFFPNRYKNEANLIYNMTVKPTDLYVISYPRSGTTWTQELIWMVANNMDYKTSNDIRLEDRFPFIEFSMLFNPIYYGKLIEETKDEHQKQQLKFFAEQPSCNRVANAKSPRYVKTHLPLSLLPPSLLDTGKVVYIARDPRDALVSFYYLNQSLGTLKCDLKTFWNLFLEDCTNWSPFFEHIKEAWEKREHPNMLFLFYEELSKDLRSVVYRACKFLDKTYTEEQITGLCEHLSFEKFKKNKSVNGEAINGHVAANADLKHIRKGKVGGWRDHFDEEMTREAKKWMEDNLRGTDIPLEI